MFEELLRKLKQCGQVEYETGECFIRILPSAPAGFPIKLEWIWDTHFTVFLDGWHQDFDSYEQALLCFTLAASGHYRLKTESKGRFRFRWTREYWDGSGWVEDSTITDLFYPFWKPTTTNYLRNHFSCEDMAHAPRPTLELVPGAAYQSGDGTARLSAPYQPAAL